MGGAALGARLTDPSAEVAGGAGAAPPRPRSIGILGGTFNPVHIGHLAVAEEARESLALDEVLFVPAGIPPHKQDRAITPAEDRVAMLELATRDNGAFVVSRLEVDRAGPSWTVETVSGLLAAADAAGAPIEVTLILSEESWVGLGTWREPDRLLSLCRVAVVPRAGWDRPVPSPGLESAHGELAGGPPAPGVVGLDGPRLQVSSSEIRARVAAGRSVRYLVPDAVIRYIGDHALYVGRAGTHAGPPR